MRVLGVDRDAGIIKRSAIMDLAPGTSIPGLGASLPKATLFGGHAPASYRICFYTYPFSDLKEKEVSNLEEILTGCLV